MPEVWNERIMFNDCKVTVLIRIRLILITVRNIYVTSTSLCFQLALAIVVCWIIAHILTVTNFFPDDSSHPNYKARTDSKLSTITMASWIYLPYPGRWRRYITSSSSPMTGAVYYNVCVRACVRGRGRVRACVCARKGLFARLVK